MHKNFGSLRALNRLQLETQSSIMRRFIFYPFQLYPHFESPIVLHFLELLFWVLVLNCWMVPIYLTIITNRVNFRFLVSVVNKNALFSFLVLYLICYKNLLCVRNTSFPTQELFGCCTLLTLNCCQNTYNKYRSHIKI